MRRVAITLAALLISGCSTYSLEELRHATPQGTPFQAALAKFYMDFAAQEEKDYDWFSSWHFADKGLLAVYGKDTAPEDLANWDIPAPHIAEMEKARAELVSVLTPEIEKAQPELAAKAQFNFDCWVEQQEEDWQDDDIAACRDHLTEALDALKAPAEPTPPPAAETKAEEPKPQVEPVKKAKAKPAKKAGKKAAKAAAKPKVIAEAKPEEEQPKQEAAKEEAAPAKEEAKQEAPEVAPSEETSAPPEPAKEETAAAPAPETETAAAEEAPKPAPAKKAKGAETVSYIVFFESGEATISASGEHVLDDVIKSFATGKYDEVVINGHADDPGDAKANLELSQARVEAVKKRLTDGGVKDEIIKSFAYGSSDPTFKTVHGQEPGNRRVEIFLNE